jgi:hypothetical protein
MSRVTLLGVSIISLCSVAFLIAMTTLQLEHAINRWRPEERGQLQCEYKSFQITNTIPPWNVDLYGNTINDGLPDCPPSRVLKEFQQFYPNISCEDSIIFHPNISNIMTLKTCNQTDLTNWLESILFKPFNCSVNGDCTQFIPFYSNRAQINFYEICLILESFIFICIIGYIINILRKKSINQEKHPFIHPPNDPPPVYVNP